MGRYFDEMQRRARAPRRDGREVHRRRGDGRLRRPVLHEDDALRAVRAAAEMRVALADLNEELEPSFGVRLAVRTGVNTGEVVAGDPASDSARHRRRRQRRGAARAGGAARRDPASADDLSTSLRRGRRGARGPLDLRGKAGPTDAWRIVRSSPTSRAGPRRFDTPLVGRDEELAMLAPVLRARRVARTSHLFTLLGAAGIGKSRLARELTAELGGDAAVLIGRCLPYGEGITYWPLREIVRSLRRCVPWDRRGGAEILRAAVGDGDAAAGPEETARAFRRLVAVEARRRPVVLGFEDIHWAEPALLELIEQVAGGFRDARCSFCAWPGPNCSMRTPASAGAR